MKTHTMGATAITLTTKTTTLFRKNKYKNLLVKEWKNLINKFSKFNTIR